MKLLDAGFQMGRKKTGWELVALGKKERCEIKHSLTEYSYHLSAGRTGHSYGWNWNWDLGKSLILRMRNLDYKTLISIDTVLEIRCVSTKRANQ